MKALIAAAALALAACSGPREPSGKDSFVIETDALRIHVVGDLEAFEANSGQILTRIETVDPEAIKPGVGLWAEDSGELELIGRITSVEALRYSNEGAL